MTSNRKDFAFFKLSQQLLNVNTQFPLQFCSHCYILHQECNTFVELKLYCNPPSKEILSRREGICFALSSERLEIQILRKYLYHLLRRGEKNPSIILLLSSLANYLRSFVVMFSFLLFLVIFSDLIYIAIQVGNLCIHSIIHPLPYPSICVIRISKCSFVFYICVFQYGNRQ